MEFGGFTAEDFDLFEIPDFPGRMGAIRGLLKPKLAALGEDLAPGVEERLGAPIYPHVAQHMRRRVNPPVETWVAFARDRKGYKRWTHVRVAVSAAGVRVTVFVENDADDKPAFAEALQSEATQLLSALDGTPVRWYTLEDEELRFDANPASLAAAGARLARVKLEKFQAGVPLPREHALRMAPGEFEAWALEQVMALRPLYRAGVTG